MNANDEMNTYQGTSSSVSNNDYILKIITELKDNIKDSNQNQTTVLLSKLENIKKSIKNEENVNIIIKEIETNINEEKKSQIDFVFKRVEEIENLIKNDKNIQLDVIFKEIDDLKTLINNENDIKKDTLLKSIEEIEQISKNENRDGVYNKILELKEFIKSENDDQINILLERLDNLDETIKESSKSNEEGFSNIPMTSGTSHSANNSSFAIDYAMLEQAIKFLSSSSGGILSEDNYDSLNKSLDIIDTTPVKTKTNTHGLKSTILGCLGVGGGESYGSQLRTKLIKLQQDCKERFPDYDLLKDYDEYMRLEQISQMNEWDSENLKNRSEELEKRLNSQISSRKANIENKKVEYLNLNDLTNMMNNIKEKKADITKYYNNFDYMENLNEAFDYMNNRNNNSAYKVNDEIEEFIDNEIIKLQNLNAERILDSSNSNKYNYASKRTNNSFDYDRYKYLTDEELQLLMIFSGYKFNTSSINLTNIEEEIGKLNSDKLNLTNDKENKNNQLTILKEDEKNAVNSSLYFLYRLNSSEENLDQKHKNLENDIANLENEINEIDNQINEINEQKYYPEKNIYYKYGNIYYDAIASNMLHHRNMNDAFTKEETDLLIARNNFYYSSKQNDSDNIIRENQKQMNSISLRKEELEDKDFITSDESQEYYNIANELAELNESSANEYELKNYYDQLKILLCKEKIDFDEYNNFDNYIIKESYIRDDTGLIIGINSKIIDENGNEIDDLTTEEKAVIYASKGIINTGDNKVDEYIKYINKTATAYSLTNEDMISVLAYNMNKSKDFEGYDIEFNNLFDYYYNQGAMKIGQERADSVINYLDNHTADWATIAAVGTWDGLYNFFDGIGNIFSADGRKDSSDYKSLYISDYVVNSGNYNDLYATLLNADYEVMNSVGNMLPSMALNIACPPLGLAAMGISATGNAREQALQEGMSEGAAWVYGILSGASEAVLEKFLGGIPGLSDMSNTVGTHGLTKLLKAGISEAEEEMLQEVLDPFFKLIATGGEVWEGEDVQAILKAGIYAFITAGIMNGGGVAFEGVSYNLTGDYTTLSTLANLHINDSSNAIQNFLTDLKYIQSCDLTGIESSLSNNPSVKESFEEYQKLHSKEEIAFNDYISDITLNSLLNVDINSRASINPQEIIQNSEGLSKIKVLQSINDILNDGKLNPIKLKEYISSLSEDSIIDYIGTKPSIESSLKLISNLSEKQIGKVKSKNPNLTDYFNSVLNTTETNKAGLKINMESNVFNQAVKTLNNKQNLAAEEITQIEELLKTGVNTTMSKTFVEEILKLDNIPHELRSILDNMLVEMGDKSSLRLKHKSTINKINQYLDQYFDNYGKLVENSSTQQTINKSENIEGVSVTDEDVLRKLESIGESDNGRKIDISSVYSVVTSKLTTEISELGATLSNIGTNISQDMISFTNNLVSQLRSISDLVTEKIKTLTTEQKTEFINKLNTFKESFIEKANSIKTSMKNGYETVIGLFNNILNNLKSMKVKDIDTQQQQYYDQITEAIEYMNNLNSSVENYGYIQLAASILFYNPSYIPEAYRNIVKTIPRNVLIDYLGIDTLELYRKTYFKEEYEKFNDGKTGLLDDNYDESAVRRSIEELKQNSQEYTNKELQRTLDELEKSKQLQAKDRENRPMFYEFRDYIYGKNNGTITDENVTTPSTLEGQFELSEKQYTDLIEAFSEVYKYIPNYTSIYNELMNLKNNSNISGQELIDLYNNSSIKQAIPFNIFEKLFNQTNTSNFEIYENIENSSIENIVAAEETDTKVEETTDSEVVNNELTEEDLYGVTGGATSVKNIETVEETESQVKKISNSEIEALTEEELDNFRTKMTEMPTEEITDLLNNLDDKSIDKIFSNWIKAHEDYTEEQITFISKINFGKINNDEILYNILIAEDFIKYLNGEQLLQIINKKFTFLKHFNSNELLAQKLKELPTEDFIKLLNNSDEESINNFLSNDNIFDNGFENLFENIDVKKLNIKSLLKVENVYDMFSENQLLELLDSNLITIDEVIKSLSDVMNESKLYNLLNIRPQFFNNLSNDQLIDYSMTISKNEDFINIIENLSESRLDEIGNKLFKWLPDINKFFVNEENYQKYSKYLSNQSIFDLILITQNPNILKDFSINDSRFDGIKVVFKRGIGSKLEIETKNIVKIGDLNLYVYEVNGKIVYSETNILSNYLMVEKSLKKAILNELLSNENLYSHEYIGSINPDTLSINYNNEIIDLLKIKMSESLNFYKGTDVKVKFGADQKLDYDMDYYSDSLSRARLTEFIQQKYQMSESDVQYVITSIINKQKGACSYANACNQIFMAFNGKSELFEKVFGFKMYEYHHNKRILNYATLLADMYMFSNSTDNGGKIFGVDENGNHSILEVTDSNGNVRLANSNEQVYMSNSEFNSNYIKYLESKGLKVLENSNLRDKLFWYGDKIDSSSLKSLIIFKILNGETLSLYECKSSNELRFVSQNNGDVISTFNWNEGGAHVTAIVGFNDEGILVASWGREYLIPYDDLYSNNFNIHSIKIELPEYKSYVSNKDIFEQLSTLDDNQKLQFFETLSNSEIINYITYFSDSITKNLLSSLTDDRLKNLIQDLDLSNFNNYKLLVENLGPDRVSKLLTDEQFALIIYNSTNSLESNSVTTENIRYLLNNIRLGSISKMLNLNNLAKNNLFSDELYKAISPVQIIYLIENSKLDNGSLEMIPSSKLKEVIDTIDLSKNYINLVNAVGDEIRIIDMLSEEQFNIIKNNLPDNLRDEFMEKYFDTTEDML